MMQSDDRLSDLQLAIMRVLWEKREATVAQVHTALHADRGLAPTTIATVLTRLEKRALVAHRVEGRQFIYRPAVDEQQVRRSMVSDLADLLFEGDVAEMMNHMITARDFSEEDLSRMRSLLKQRADQEGADDVDR